VTAARYRDSVRFCTENYTFSVPKDNDGLVSHRPVNHVHIKDLLAFSHVGEGAILTDSAPKRDIPHNGTESVNSASLW
jgi:hypothetical protein